jgi:hypothetical protein
MDISDVAQIGPTLVTAANPGTWDTTTSTAPATWDPSTAAATGRRLAVGTPQGTTRTPESPVDLPHHQTPETRNPFSHKILPDMTHPHHRGPLSSACPVAGLI